MSSEGTRRGTEEQNKDKKSGKKEILFIYLKDISVSVLIVLIIAFLLYSFSGIWPPMVAIKSESMEPNMNKGDLIVIVDQQKFVPSGVETQCNCGIITSQNGQNINYNRFGMAGDVVVYIPNGDPNRQPVIHRAMMFVKKGDKIKFEDRTITADHSGFLTKGDNNQFYDQVGGISEIVKPEWIQGKAKYRLPYLGTVRLLFPF